MRFPITRSLASRGFRLACPPSRATACLNRLCPHLRVNTCAFRPNGMAARGSSVLGLTIMRLVVRVGDCRTCSGCHPTTARMRKRYRTPHLHSVWRVLPRETPPASFVSARTCESTHSFPAKRNGGARVVSAGGVDNAVVRQGRGCRTCSGRHPTTARTRKRCRTTHLHSVWPPRHTENAYPCR